MPIVSTLPKFAEPLNEAIRAVQKAAMHIANAAQQNVPLQVTVKPDATLVLNLDLELQHILMAHLTQLPVVSEEMPETYHRIGTREDYFVIDPLDGTTSAKRFLTAANSQVGFGPMVGVVENGVLLGAVFYNAPQQKFFVAEKGKGCFMFGIQPGQVPELLRPDCSLALTSCAVLFYAGLKGELEVITKMKKADLVENFYRFGGFANDCSRLAQGFEQIQVQFAVKAWDLPAALLVREAGLDVMIDPLSECVALSDWVVQAENPLISAPRFEELKKYI